MWSTAFNASWRSNWLRAKPTTGGDQQFFSFLFFEISDSNKGHFNGWSNQEQEYSDWIVNEKIKDKYGLCAFTTVRESKTWVKVRWQMERIARDRKYASFVGYMERDQRWVQMCRWVYSEKQVNQRCSYAIAFCFPCNFINGHINQYPHYLVRWS